MKLSNQTTLFVATHILTPHPPAARLTIFRKWIKVASILFQLSTYNAVFEVLHALTHHAVWRLRLSEELGGEERDNLTKLCLFVSSDDNYKVYRRVMKTPGGGRGEGGDWRERRSDCRCGRSRRGRRGRRGVEGAVPGGGVEGPGGDGGESDRSPGGGVREGRRGRRGWVGNQQKR